MNILLTILSASIFMTLLDATCNVEKAYNLIGTKEISSTVDVQCSNKDDNCAILVGDIPELFVGQYQDCSSNIFTFINTNLLTKRPDLKIQLDASAYIANATANCIKNEISITSGKLLPSNYSLFISCSPSNTAPSIVGAPLIPPLSGAQKPVACSLGNNKTKLCTEGYCSMFEYSINNTEQVSTSFATFFGCPNDLYDSLDTLLYNGVTNGVTFDNLQSLARQCVNKNSTTFYGTSEPFEYFYYINCNSDPDKTIENIPSLPPKMTQNVGKVCPYQVTGYFANSTSQIINKTIDCVENYCTYLDVTVLNVDGIFQGCQSALLPYFNEMNNITKGVLNGTIDEFLTKCHEKTYKYTDIIGIIKIYMDCYAGDHPDMSGKKNSSSNLPIGFSLILCLIAYIMRY
uniref:Transmembrane protein n=1 Tax=Parastrongyloides trichosuri TaxID=131310 RepID=A0A0N4Z9V0_PARTI